MRIFFPLRPFIHLSLAHSFARHFQRMILAFTTSFTPHGFYTLLLTFQLLILLHHSLYMRFFLSLFFLISRSSFSCTSASDDWTCPFCDWMVKIFSGNRTTTPTTMTTTAMKKKHDKNAWLTHKYSCMHWGVSCKVHQNIQRLLWEIIFDHHNRYYIDLYVQILTFERSKMVNYVRACTATCITKVRHLLLFVCV